MAPPSHAAIRVLTTRVFERSSGAHLIEKEAMKSSQQKGILSLDLCDWSDGEQTNTYAFNVWRMQTVFLDSTANWSACTCGCPRLVVEGVGTLLTAVSERAARTGLKKLSRAAGREGDLDTVVCVHTTREDPGQGSGLRRRDSPSCWGGDTATVSRGVHGQLCCMAAACRASFRRSTCAGRHCQCTTLSEPVGPITWPPPLGGVSPTKRAGAQRRLALVVALSA
jgi:hypothetical protein